MKSLSMTMRPDYCKCKMDYTNSSIEQYRVKFQESSVTVHSAEVILLYLFVTNRPLKGFTKIIFTESHSVLLF